VTVPGIGKVEGDVAWGGNWFFLVYEHGQEIALHNLDVLTDYSWRVREALKASGITGAAGAEIDHIELFAHSRDAGVDSKNFVLCPGKAYDRSPCGTGTSAKLACLAANGALAPGKVYRQASVLGSVFEASYAPGAKPGEVIPTITGTAHVCAEADLILDSNDPFVNGVRH
jgi:4-hydroxyproline epimerase